jgi:hypothetical protein
MGNTPSDLAAKEREWIERATEWGREPEEIERGLLNLRHEYWREVWSRGPEALAARAAGVAASLRDDTGAIAAMVEGRNDWQSIRGVLARAWLDGYRNARRSLRGNLEAYFETGSEGTWWAFLDERFGHIPDDTRRCRKCGTYPPTRSTSVLVAARSVPLSDLDENLAMPPTCEESDPPGAHEFELAYPDGRSSYDGLHLLESGDALTIFDPTDRPRVVWQGVVDLSKTTTYEEAIAGLWIHNRQAGVDDQTWLRWFEEGFPAVLERPVRDGVTDHR